MMASRDHAPSTCGPIPHLACDYCGEAAFSDDWSDVANAFVCEACVETALFNQRMERTL